MWYTRTGLNNNGTTTHYQFAYDSGLATPVLGNIEPTRTNALLANAPNGVPFIENDFAWMKGLFNNIELLYAYTISSPVTGGVTYVPNPPGVGDSFAGLFTIDLPTPVVTGQDFDVVVRHSTTRRNVRTVVGRQPVPAVDSRTDVASAPVVNSRIDVASEPERDPLPQATHKAALFAVRKQLVNWRYITGTFQIRIPVGSPGTLLAPERNTLAIFKWRLLQMSPANRWYSVLKRYMLNLSARVNELGGNADAVPASPLGYW